uniref:Uncharacterized protein n=1 Tax=Cyprinus carpio carpio TaxID=630221 RepID=A0A8C1EBQ2_CYPCA
EFGLRRLQLNSTTFISPSGLSDIFTRIYFILYDPVTRLKDLAQLKDQLEEIQKKVENEVQAGIPQGGSLLASPFLKGFLAGYVISKLRSSAVLGVALGTLTGIYAAQNYQVPNIETSLRDFLSSLKKGPSD